MQNDEKFELTFALQEIEHLQDHIADLEDQLTRYPWPTFLWGMVAGLILGGIPFFLTLRHFNLLG